MKALLTAVIAALSLGAAACSSDEPAPPATVQAVTSTGRDLFEERIVGINPGCVTCHSLQEGVTIVGPSLFDVSSRDPELTDAQYIRESIVAPDSFVVEGFSAGQMSADWETYLSDAQIDSLVDFLLGD